MRLQGSDTAVASEQIHRADMISEAAFGVVVLAVDIAGDRSADGYLACSGENRDPNGSAARIS
ncbi:hypothetical protein GCM10020255_017960 [Rhodococcus baikonurensis]